MPTSHFIQYFPLMIDSMIYGFYSALFFQSMQILLSRRGANFKLYLICTTLLFLLSTTHIMTAWAWAFTADSAAVAIYEVLSLDNPPPPLSAPGDPPVVLRLARLVKARYAVSNAIADGILLHRLYIIWGYDWRAVVLPGVAYVVTSSSIILGLLPLSGAGERAALALCVATTFFTNVVASLLAAGRIWWISRRVSLVLNRSSRRIYANITAILLESGLIYPTSLIVTIAIFLTHVNLTQVVLTCMAVNYHVVSIAPTLIIVRVGLGVSTDDVDKCINSTRSGSMSRSKEGARAGPALSTLRFFGPQHGQETTIELGVRADTVQDGLDPGSVDGMGMGLGTFGSGSDTTKV